METNNLIGFRVEHDFCSTFSFVTQVLLDVLWIRQLGLCVTIVA